MTMSPHRRPDDARRRPPTGRARAAQRILVALLALEVAVFAAIGTNFLSRRQRLRGRCG